MCCWRHPPPGRLWLLGAGFAAELTLISMACSSQSRFHIPAMPFMVLYAGWAIARLAERRPAGFPAPTVARGSFQQEDRVAIGMKTTLKRLFQALPEGVRYEMFYQAGLSLGVEGYVVQGSVGPFVGALRDQSVIRPYLRDREFSSNIVALFEEFFHRHGGGVFLDIGANIGLISVPVCRCAGVSGFAFEPDPENFGMLRANLARNDVRCQASNVAVADRCATMKFTRSRFNYGDHRLSEAGELEVDVVALDGIALPPGPLAVKIDTQGAEPLIFAGGEKTLAAAGLIVCEFWPWGMRRMGTDPQVVLDFARTHFPAGHVLRPGQRASGEPRPIGAIFEELRKLVGDGGENAQADLVLVGQSG